MVTSCFSRISIANKLEECSDQRAPGRTSGPLIGWHSANYLGLIACD